MGYLDLPTTWLFAGGAQLGSDLASPFLIPPNNVIAMA